MIWQFLLFFFLGTLFGSLGSVLLTRLAESLSRETISSCLVGRSHCPHCRKNLQWYQLIPLVSFFVQQGKCPTCRAHIGFFYPLLELVSGCIFVGTYWFTHQQGIGFGLEMVFWFAVNRLLGLLLLRDIRTWTLHMPLWILLACVALSGQFLLQDRHIGFLMAILFGLLFLGMFAFGKRYIRQKTKRLGHTLTLDNEVLTQGFGEGDIWLGGLIGLLFGFVFFYQGLSFSLRNIAGTSLSYLLLSSLLGIVFFVCGLLFQQKKSNQAAVPFFPAMIVAFWIMLVWGKLVTQLILGE